MAAHTISLPIAVSSEVSTELKITPATPRRTLACVMVVKCAVLVNLVHSRRRQLQSSMSVVTGGAANLKLGKRHRLSLSMDAVTSMQSKFCTLANGATVRDAVRSIVALWGQSSGSDDSPEVAEAVGFLNAAIQRLHESGKDYGFVGRVRRFYSGNLPVSSVELESDVQHVDGRVVFLPLGGYWSIPMSTSNVNISGFAQIAAGIDADDSTTQAISVNNDVAAKFATFTGLTCEWDATARAVRVYSPGASSADNPPLKNAAGSRITKIEGIDWGIQYLTHPDVDFVAGTLTPLRSLDSAESLSAARSRMAGVVYSDNTDLRRPIFYHVKSDNSGGRLPLLHIELAPAAEYVSGSGDADLWELQADVFLEPPRFSCCDVRNGTRLPVPHRYAESLVIPLARYFALSSRYRVQESTVAFVREQAAQALALLGEVDPRAKESQENRREVPK